MDLDLSAYQICGWAKTTATALYLEDISLSMSAHGSPCHTNNQGRERIETSTVAGWLGNAGRSCGS